MAALSPPFKMPIASEIDIDVTASQKTVLASPDAVSAARFIVTSS